MGRTVVTVRDVLDPTTARELDARRQKLWDEYLEWQESQLKQLKKSREEKLVPITASLAANVVAVLAPYVAVGAQEFAKSVGREAYEKAKGMLAVLKAKWTGDKAA